MGQLVWDADGARLYETGVKKGVLYPISSGAYPLGVAWNGLSAINESPSGAEENAIYADDQKYLSLMSAEQFNATLEAYTYPDEFMECDGSAALSAGVNIGQQTRKTFGLCYKTIIGNDEDDIEYGYKIHIIYGAKASPSEKAYNTINEDPEAITFSWEISTTPVEVTGKKPTASIVIDSTKVDAAKLAILEDILYGTTVSDPRLPLPDEIATLFTEAAPSAVAIDTCVPDDGDVDVVLDSNIVITFNNAIGAEQITVIKDGGTLIAGVKSWDATNKILTFNPTASFDSAGAYTIVIAGVVDIYGQALASVAYNFTCETV